MKSEAFGPGVMMRSVRVALMVAAVAGVTAGTAWAQLSSIGSVPVATTAAVDVKSSLAKLRDDKTRVEAAKEIELAALRAGRPGAEAERAALAGLLAAALGEKELPAGAKAEVLRAIEYVGREESVAAVAALLDDRDIHVAEHALAALSQNPTDEAGKVLVGGLSKDSSKQRIAVIAALGHRGRGGVEEEIAKCLGERETFGIAAAALGDIGTKTAAEQLDKALTGLRNDSQDRRAVIDALLKCADRLAAKDPAGAGKVYARIEADGSLPAWVQLAGFRGALISAPAAAGAERAIASLDSTDLGRQVIAEEYLAGLAGEGADKALAARYPAMTGSGKAAALRVFTARRSAAARELMLAGAASAHAAVKSAAIRALGRVGNASEVPLLAKIASTDGPDQIAARESLAVLTGAGVEDAILSGLKSPEERVRAEMLKALASRNSLERADLVLAVAGKDNSEAVRTEALRTLEVLARPAQIEKILAILVAAGSDAEREAAEVTSKAVLARIASAEDRAAPLLPALEKATGPARLPLIRLLGRTGTPKALAAIREALAASDESTHDAAVRALADWPTPEVLPQLLAMARGEKKESHKVLATRGYIRLASQKSERPAKETAALFADILPMTRPEEKKQAIGGLGGVSCLESIALLEKHFEDVAVATEAMSAAVRASRPLARSSPDEVIRLMKIVVEKTPQNDYTHRGAESAIREAERARTAATQAATQTSTPKE